MERCTAEWVTARAFVSPAEAGHYTVSGSSRTRNASGDLDPGLLVPVARTAGNRWIASGERQPAPIEDGPARNRCEHVGQSFVVLIAANTVGLHTEMRPCNEHVGANHLYVEEHGKDDDRRGGKSRHDVPHAGAEGRGDLRHR